MQTLQVEAILQHPNGPWRENAYVLHDAAGNALIFDPGSDEAALIALINEKQLTPHAILNTHGHYDHIGAVTPLMAHYEIPFYLHSGDKKLLRRANLYATLFDGSGRIDPPQHFIDLKDCPNPLSIGGFSLALIHTPGHTDGGVCFLIEGHCLVGDTLFKDQVGRIDLPGGDATKLASSLKRLGALPQETLLYPGHGPVCTLEEAITHNHSFRQQISLE